MTRLRSLPWLLAGCIGVLATLPGCHAFKLTYNHLDWLAGWQVGRFVDLDPPQKALFDDRFRQFWGWHRGTQLAIYAHDLREIATVADHPLTPAQVDAYLRRATDHMARTMQEAVPDTSRVLQTLDDRQVGELLSNLAERRAKTREESQDLTAEELLQRAEAQMVKNLKRWIGSLSRDQKRRVHEWAQERQYAGTIWHQYQEAWATAFTAVLAHRREPDFVGRLREFFDGGKVPYGEEMARVQAHNRQVLIGLLADISAMLTPAQQQHFRDRLRALAADLDELATESQKAALPGLIG